ncbi:MAG: NmrA/HSCARG family protein [Chamaesiphon sp.]
MTDQKIILVIGATGAQGGSVAYHLLSGNKFVVRCLTRHPNSEKAMALKAVGAEIVKGDLEDINSLYEALKGCYGVFGVTNFWEHFGKEYQQGKNLVDAVAEANLEHFIFSTLPFAKKISNGEIEVPHFDIKGQLEEYARDAFGGLRSNDRVLGITFVHVAFYFENFLSHFLPQKQADNSFAFGFPQGDTPLAGVGIEDLGGVVAAIFDKGAEFRDKVVGVVGDDLVPKRYAEVMTRVLGKPVVYNYIPREVFASFNFPGADDLANMFEFNRLYIPNSKTELGESRKLSPKIQTFESWLSANKDKFQDILGA